MQHHKYALSDIENMMVWEREVYVKLLIDHLEKTNKQNSSQPVVHGQDWEDGVWS